MMIPASSILRQLETQCCRTFSTSVVKHKDGQHYKLVVVGGGAGGCAVASRACRALGQGQVAVVEPSEKHYNQPLWTLVGAGIKPFRQSEIKREDAVPKKCRLYEQGAAGFEPEKNKVVLTNGTQLSYDYLVIALGIQVNYHKVDGLVDALKEDPTVCSNYNSHYVTKTYPAIQKFKGGNAVFTFPNTPIKCAGAPQKIMYLAEEYWKKHGVKDKTQIHFNTALPVIFGVPKYAERLMGVAKRKNIQLNFRHNLTAVDHTKKEATFELLDSTDGETKTVKYDFLHATPPMSGPDVLKSSTTPITDAAGFLSVNRETLQHTAFPNIFGIGDCTNVPTSKTAAAVACQNKILFDNMLSVMAGKATTRQYDGYTSCPLVTSYNKCILAEFDFDGSPLETFPFDQGKERRTMFHLKKDVMPRIYWHMLIRGHWAGPKKFRKALHLGMSK